MKQFILPLTILLLIGCQANEKREIIVTENCDNTELIEFVYPIDQFIQRKVLRYSLKATNQEEIDYYNILLQPISIKDSLFLKLTENAKGITSDSTIISFKNGIPKIIKTYTRVEIYPELLPAKKIAKGNEFCEFATYYSSFEYDIPTEEGTINRKFEGYVNHTKNTTEYFNGKKYQCAIYKAEKILTAKIKWREQTMKGNWEGCYCKGLGELYSKVTTEDGLIIRTKLVEIK